VRSRFGALALGWRIAIVGGAAAVYLCALWLLVVSPKRAEASSLKADVADAEARLAVARGTSGRPQQASVPVSDLFRLAKAMPSSGDQAGLVLELDRLAARTRVDLGTVTLQEAVVASGGATTIPVAVTVTGSYRGVGRFLGRMQQLVKASGGKVRATGRLFTVQSVELTESKARGFPVLDAAILLNAYVYDGPIAPPAVTPPPSDDTDASSGSTAAGATP
jgi:Tfp pilus assembly protein PilO